MRYSLLIALIVILSASCTSEFSKGGRQSDHGDQSGDTISEESYTGMLADLNEMFDVVNAKAECILDSGVNKKDLRSHLKNDSEYSRICSKARIIDSILTSYVASGRATSSFLREYKETTARAAKKAQKTGLY